MGKLFLGGIVLPVFLIVLIGTGVLPKGLLGAVALLWLYGGAVLFGLCVLVRVVLAVSKDR